MSSRQWRGRWWLPAETERAVGGDLTLSADEFVLTTDGPLRTAEIPKGQTKFTELFQRVVEPVIFGRTRDGSKLTLLECEGALPVIPAEVNAGEWRPRSALVGAHLEPHELRFSAVDIELRHLADWADGLHFSHSLTYETQDKRVTGVEATAERKVLGEAQVGDTRIELGLVPIFTTRDLTAEIGHYPRFRVESAQSFSWEQAMENWVRPLRDLVSFATTRPASLEHIRLRPTEELDEPGRLVELLLQLTDLKRPEQETKRLSPYDVLFTASELPGEFGDGLARWFELHATYASVIGRMLSVVHAPFIYEDQRFLALAQAAEAYHGIAIGGTPTPKEEHKEKVFLAAADLADPDLKSWAVPILAESNRFHLTKRLEQLLVAADSMGELISVPDRETFLKRTVKTRNYLTHHGEKHPLVLSGLSDLFWHGEALAWLLRVLLMGQLGFSEEEIAKRVGRTPRFQGFRKGMDETAKTLRQLRGEHG